MRVLFSRNFAYAKFRENKTLAKISKLTVLFFCTIQERKKAFFENTIFALVKVFKIISGLEVIKLEYSLKVKIKCNDWLLADTCRKQPIIVLYFEFENELQFLKP